jgi:hypothetical protein
MAQIIETRILEKKSWEKSLLAEKNDEITGLDVILLELTFNAIIRHQFSLII